MRLINKVDDQYYTWNKNLANLRYKMTLPDERYHAVLWAGRFLERLSYSGETKRIPLKIRQEARSILKHFPSNWDMERAAQSCPEVFQERIEEVARLFQKYEQSKAEKNES